MSIFELPVSFSLDKHPVVASRFSGYNKRKIHTKNQEGAMKKDPFFHCYEEMKMCGRYYIDSDMADEIQQVVREVDQRIRKAQFTGDIHPTESAPVIEKSENGLKLSMCKWGYPLSKRKSLVINARVESVMDKASFRNGILYHRVLIPASGFYEWNWLKEKNTFTRPDAPVLYMAGFCDWFENERRFVILTTKANASMEKVHERMPLILEKEQIVDWFQNEKMEKLLQYTPIMLKREAEYEQQSLFL